ncbi:MAG: 16S rRNA (guanine(527)-N(7))-methyltransferase RsmG [Actinomycetes bacterium]
MVSRETLLESYFQEKRAEISRYAQMLGTIGIERGLIGPKEGDRIWDRHIANCIPVTTLIPQGASVVDIGSGAGLPGIVIALARPDTHLTLVEPLQRRVDFLNEVVLDLDLSSQITVVRGKAEGFRGSFDVVTSRAVAPLPKLLPMVRHLIKSGGSLLAIKGESAQAEIEATPLNKQKALLHEIQLPDFDMARVIEVQKA